MKTTTYGRYVIAILVGIAALVAMFVVPETNVAGAADNSPPTMATNVAANVSTNNGASVVALSWTAATDDAGIHSYDVFRDGAWIGWSPGAGTNWTDTNPTSNSHVYRLRAFDTSLNWGQLSTPLTVAIGGADTQRPPKVTGLTGSVRQVNGSPVVDVSWNPSIDNVGIHSYDIFRDGLWVGWTAGATSWTDTNPTADSYVYRVRAIDTSFNYASLSEGATVAIDEGGVDTQPPPTVTGVSANVTDGANPQVQLSWNPSIDNVGVHSYDIFRDGAWAGWTPGGTTTWTDANPTPNSSHVYRVRSIDTSFNWGDLSSPLSVSVDGGFVPERFVTGWPHTFVDRVTGEPVFLNGVNVTARVVNNGMDVYRSDLQRIADAGFNMIRLQLAWQDFNTGPGQFNNAALTDLERLVRDADAVGLHVLLDPLHSIGPDYGPVHWFNVPAWVWAQPPAAPNKDAAEDIMLDRLHDWAPQYLVEMATRFANQPAVVGIDLISEARAYPPIANNPADSANNQVFALYNKVINQVRAVDSDKILMIEPIYGNSDLSQADFGIIQNRSNVAITIHYYYAGGHPTGFDPQGTGNVGFHTWDGVVGYPIWDGNTGFDRAVLQGQMANHLQLHLDLLEPWGIPLHIGEYAINPDANNSYEWIDDVLTVFDNAIDQYDPGRPAAEVRMSRTWWRWTRDGGFELYNSQTGVKQWIVDMLIRPG